MSGKKKGMMKMSKKDPITLEEWYAKGEELFGKDRKKWKFVCPSCGVVTAVEEWLENDAEGQVAFSCIGRSKGSKNSIGSEKQPCNYAGGGLFALNPVDVIDEDGKVHSFFDFYVEEGGE